MCHYRDTCYRPASTSGVTTGLVTKSAVPMPRNRHSRATPGHGSSIHFNHAYRAVSISGKGR